MLEQRWSSGSRRAELVIRQTDGATRVSRAARTVYRQSSRDGRLPVHHLHRVRFAPHSAHIASPPSPPSPPSLARRPCRAADQCIGEGEPARRPRIGDAAFESAAPETAFETAVLVFGGGVGAGGRRTPRAPRALLASSLLPTRSIAAASCSSSTCAGGCEEAVRERRTCEEAALIASCVGSAQLRSIRALPALQYLKGHCQPWQQQPPWQPRQQH